MRQLFLMTSAISTFIVPALSVLFIYLDLNLNDLESVKLSFGSSLQYCYKLPDVSA